MLTSGGHLDARGALAVALATGVPTEAALAHPPLVAPALVPQLAARGATWKQEV